MKDVDYYRGLPYSRRYSLVLDQPESPFWLAWFEELPACRVEGNTKSEASLYLQELFVDYIQAKLEWGSQIPEPKRSKAKHNAVTVQLDYVVRGKVYKTRQVLRAAALTA